MSVGFRRIRAADVPQAAIPALLALLAGVATAGPVWGDEQVTLRIVADYTAPEIVTAVATNQPHLPTFYLLVEALTYIPGPTPLLARGLSLAATVATVAVVYHLGTRWFDAPTALVGATLLALSPLHAVQGTWIRMYPLFGLAAALSWLFLDHVRTDDTARLAYLVTTLAAVSLHPYGLFLVAAHAVWFGTAARRWREPAGAAVASLPAALYLTMKATASWGPSSGVRHVTTPPTATEVLLAPLATLTGSVVSNVQLAVLLVVLITAAAAPLGHADRDALAAVATWIIVPLAAATAVSHLVQPLLMLKYLAWLTPPVALLVAHRCRTARFGTGVLAALLGTQGALLALTAADAISYTLARAVTYGLF